MSPINHATTTATIGGTQWNEDHSLPDGDEVLPPLTWDGVKTLYAPAADVNVGPPRLVMVTPGGGSGATLRAGDAVPPDPGQTLVLSGGSSVDDPAGAYLEAVGAELTIGGGDDAGAGGEMRLIGGAARSGSAAQGGDITLQGGAGDGAGRNGLIFLNLPTSDPGVAGALYCDAADGNRVKVS